MCGGSCVNVRRDPLNCGDCGRACASDEVCVAGDCKFYRTSDGLHQLPVRKLRRPQVLQLRRRRHLRLRRLPDAVAPVAEGPVNLRLGFRVALGRALERYGVIETGRPPLSWS
jgi:hypothetical protein